MKRLPVLHHCVVYTSWSFEISVPILNNLKTEKNRSSICHVMLAVLQITLLFMDRCNKTILFFCFFFCFVNVYYAFK